MTIPAVKLIPVYPSVHPPSTSVPPLQDSALRSLGDSPQLSQIRPADLRWSRVDEFLRSRELQPNTRKAYEREFKAFLGWTPKGWHEITARDLDRYKEYLKEQPSKRGGKRSAATINLALSALQSIFKWLCARDYIPKDPMVLIEKPKSAPIVPREWSLEEVKALFDATAQRGETQPRDRAVLWILLHGLRAREVEGLNVGDFDGQRVHIREAKDDSVGQVPLLPEAVETLVAYLNLRRCSGAGVEPESPLFLSESNNSKGQRLSYWGIYKVIKDLAAIAGLEQAHPHQGRHTVATEMINRGMDPLLARQITRHKSEKSFERYSKRSLQKQAEAQFLQIFGEGESPVNASVSGAIELESKPMPVGASGSAVTVLLKLKVEDRNLLGGKSAKVKRAIESQVLSRFVMVKPKRRSGEYELTIPFVKEDEISARISEILWEMNILAELEDCSVTHDFSLEEV